jgi:hypothetical protein
VTKGRGGDALSSSLDTGIGGNVYGTPFQHVRAEGAPTEVNTSPAMKQT